MGDVLQVKLNDKNYAKEINKVSIVWYAVIMRVFSGLKEIINNICLDNLTSPYGELLSGMTLGVKEIPPKFNENLIKTGVIHVVVVSGFNISLVISALFPLFIFLGRKKALIVSIVGIFCFVLLVGFEAPVIRAAIMGLIVLFGKFYGREKNAIAILAAAAFIMLFVNPLIIYDLSFILSFLATFGLITFSSLIKILIKKVDLFGLEEDLISTLSAQLMIWPIISYFFGRISIISPLVNILVLWIVPLATVMGFVYIILTVILSFLKLAFLISVVSFIVKAPLIYFSQVVNYFANLKFAQIDFQVDKAFLIIYYLLMSLIVIWILRKKEIKL